jgi:large subunit ribosomal protein L9
MAAIEVILLQRVEKLGQMGERVKVKPGYARNFLLPQKKALRATKENTARFETERVVLEAQNLKRREEAESVAERVRGLSVTLIRQAGDSGSLYGSVSNRDIADGATAGGLVINRTQVELDHPIKTLGVRMVRVVLRPEEAEKQGRGEAVGRAAGEDADPTAEELGFDDETEAAA